MSMADNYRYPGPSSFSFEQRSIFFGRDEDIANMRTSVIVNPTTVLFGKSGTGKSSLIQAGLIPKLLEGQEEARVPYLIINVMPRLYEKSKNLWEEVKAIITKKIEPNTEFLQIPGLRNSSSLWYILKGLQYRQYVKKISQTVLIIFDQCEELFTYPDSQIDKLVQELLPVIGQFIPEEYQKIISRQKASLSSDELKVLYEPLVIKFLFSIRSDKLHLITRLKKASPYILQNSYELLPLTKPRTFEAIDEPSAADGDFTSTKFTVTDEAKEYIFEELAAQENDMEDLEEARIDPFSLQIICSYIERNIVPYNKIITKDSFKEPQEIIKGYYEDSINKLKATDEEKIKVKNFIELKLLQNNRRIPIHESLIIHDEKNPVSDEMLKELVEFRILKKDISVAGGLMYEITHDCFIEPITEARDERLGKTYESQSLETINELLKKIQAKESSGIPIEMLEKPISGLQEGTMGKQVGTTAVASASEDFNLGDLYKRLGDAYVVVKDYQQAIASYSKAIESETNQNNITLIETYRARANAYSLILDYPHSIEDFNKILELNPEDYIAVYALGANNRDAGNIPEAIKYFGKAAELNPGNGGIYTDIGNIYFGINEYEKAKTYYLKNVQKNVDADYAWSNLGLVAETLGNTDEALENYNKALKLNPLANTYNTVGNIYFGKKDYDNARVNYLKALNINGNFYYAAYNIGLIEENQEHWDAAIYNYKKAIDLYPNYENAYLGLAIIYYKNGDYITSKEKYLKLISINDKNETYYTDLGVIEQKLKNWEPAIADYKRAIELNPNYKNDEINNDIGLCYFNLDDWKNAEVYFTKAVERQPGNYLYLNNLSAAKLNSGDFAGAEMYINKTLELNPNYPIAYFNYGNLLGKQNNTKDAIGKYKKAIELDPNYEEAYMRLADIYFKDEDYNSTKEIYTKLNSIKPSENYFSSLGLIEERLGNPDAAMDLYKKAIDLNPNYIVPYEAIGNIYFSNDEYQKAKEIYIKLIAIKPEEGNYYFNLGEIERYQDNWVEAINNYNKAMELKGSAEDDEINNDIGHCYSNLGDWKNAEVYFIKATDKNPGDYGYLNNLSSAKLNLGNFKDAEKYIKETLELNQEYAPAYFNYGYLLEKLNNTKDAIEKYKKCLALNPDYSDAKERLEALEKP